MKYLAKTRIDAGVLSDHNFVFVGIRYSSEVRGPGLWRFNNTLLEDFEFIGGARTEIQEARNHIGIYEVNMSKGLHVELLLSKLREIAIKRGKQIASEMRINENNLYQKLNNLEVRIANEPSDQITAEYERVRSMLDDIKLNRGQLAILRSQAVWLEQGERPSSRYFFRLAKQKMAQKTITALLKSDGTTIRGNDAILSECLEHYKTQFKSRDVNPHAFLNFYRNENDPCLTEEEKIRFEGLITNVECRVALANMARNKAAGISGFSADFFSFFWEDMGEMIVEYINDAKEKQIVFVTHRRGVVNLIPKKGNQMLLANKRPICLLDVLYKLIAKVIANRISRVIGRIINRNQTGF